MYKPLPKINAVKRPVRPALAALLLLTGCEMAAGPSAQGQSSDAGPVGTVSGKRYYKVTEKRIPDPKTSFENDDPVYADEKVTLSPVDSFCTNGSLYFLYQILYEVEDNAFTGSYCLGVLHAPYEQWEYHIFSSWDLAADFGFAPVIQRILAVSGDGLYFQANGSVGFYGWDSSCKTLREIESKSVRLALYPAGETLYAVSSDGVSPGSFTAYDRDLQPILTQNLQNRISGCISLDPEYLWYGFDESGNLTVWDKPNGNVRFSLGDVAESYSDFLLTGTAGKFLLAGLSPDINGIWTGDGNSPLEKALSFSEMGYNLQELLTVSANGDGFFVTAYFEDKLCFLTFEQTETPNRQDITVVSSDIYLLEQVAAAFNRQSDKYRVVVSNPFASGDIEAYCGQLQMEMSAGGGPDLMDAWLIDMDGCIKNGYLEPLNDVIENPSDYWPAILDAGETDNVLYGIPMRFLLSFLSVSKSLAGDLKSWDLLQMMEAVQNSPAESLQMGFDSMDIVLQYGLATRDIPQFIDYDAGVSHLAEQPFIDFLEFSRQYGDDLYYADTEYKEAADYYRDGRLAALSLELYSPGDLLIASSCFQGQEVLIGMPAAEGRGVYMQLVELCLNSNSPSKEGAREFLRYLMSEEGQLLFMKDIRGGFSCRRDVTKQLVNEYQDTRKKRPDSETAGITIYWGIGVESAALTDEQLAQFYALLEDAKPEPSIPSEIKAIVQEELEPFFAGNRSAEEAARNLHNRVQLYLDEQG